MVAKAVHCSAQHSTAWRGTARHSTAHYSMAQHSSAKHGTAQHGTAQHSSAKHGTTQHITARHSTAQHILGPFWTSVCKHGEPQIRTHTHDGTTPTTRRTTHRALCDGVDVALSPGTGGRLDGGGGALSAEGHQYRGFIWSQGAEHLAIVFQNCLLEAPPPFTS